ncbi:MAG: hypothetical protein LBR72_01655, partial [Oscillospiraceae bacterium]|nr:hypothetical protein [Oscillospiraceae bacterium]
MKLKLTAAFLTCALLLASCGGGASGPGTPAPGEPSPSVPEPTPPESAEAMEMENGAPQNVVLTNADGTASLRWDEVPGARGYNVYRAGSRYGEYAKLNAEPIPAASYADPVWDGSFHYKITGVSGEKETGQSKEVSGEISLWGPNVLIFSPDDDPSAVGNLINNIRARQVSNQFGKQRYALLFKPGVYSPDIEVKVGFYTHAAGLGLLPTDTSLEKLTCDARWLSSGENNNATCNFWRASENFSVRSDTLWAVSQAVSMRRMEINGNLY